MTAPASIKDEVIRLVESLPDDFTWDDLMRTRYVRQAIEAGLQASPDGRIVSTGEARRRLVDGRTPAGLDDNRSH